MHRFDSQPAYILHTWAYRETSLLLEVFTKDHGRLGVLAKGVRKPKSRARGLLQPFVPLLIGASGRGDLLVLKDYESFGALPYLTGRRLISAFYLNELMMRLLQRFDPNLDLFAGYTIAIAALADEKQSIEPILRIFEKVLLKTLGYELQLIKEAKTGEAVEPQKLYRYEPEEGPVWVDVSASEALYPERRLYQGSSLLALAAEELTEGTVLSEVKRLMREALLLYLGNRPIESRKLL